MVVHGIDTQANDLDVAAIELRLDPSHVAEFGRADRGEVLGVGEQHTPGVPKPLVEANSTFRRLSLKIWRGVANLKSHAGPLGSFGDNAAARLCVAHIGRPPGGDRVQEVRDFRSGGGRSGGSDVLIGITMSKKHSVKPES